jgi:iron(III) transport system permease protein
MITIEQRKILRVVLLCLIGYAALPWYALDNGLLNTAWISGVLSDPKSASGIFQALRFERAWLWIGLIPIAGGALAAFCTPHRMQRGKILVVTGALTVVLLLIQGLTIGAAGWSFTTLEHSVGALPRGQLAIGAGGIAVTCASIWLLSIGLAYRGYFKGDTFVATAVVGIVMLISFFTILPIAKMLSASLLSPDGDWMPAALPQRLFTEKIWSLACLTRSGRCGVAWNTLLLATLTGIGATTLGLAFALVATRTSFRYKKLLRLLTVLPVITPPFVIGLGLILLFGRSGLVNQLLESVFGIAPSRWIYGLPGVLLAQIFAFTPIAFLVLIGVVEGVSPTMEEAAQTLRANRWQTFTDVTLPLMRPGIVNAFLVAFIESIADFGNPIVLGGDFGVLSTEIFFSIVGAQLDYGRAAALALILLFFALSVFFIQRKILGNKSYTSMSGKADSGRFIALPITIQRSASVTTMAWATLTVIVYAMAIAGGFVETWGRDYSFTLKHYAKAFSIDSGVGGIVWSGGAWASFWTTIKLASLAAPITAFLGILTAYLLTRQQFAGRNAFEFATMLSFAVPGTVIGVAYILAFNVPPLELTGTAAILLLCFVFRNMPVGVRAGMAAMSQIDKNLDEAALTLRASAWTALTTVILPLLKPAVVAALVYSFVRSVTTVSAIIFLVSPDHELATVYIINRVLASDYGVAIAYATVLIVLMLLAIGAIRLLVGDRKLGRESTQEGASATPISQTPSVNTL